MTAVLYPFPAARRVKPARIVPQLGTVDQGDDGSWTATALNGRQFGPFRFRPEACEVLLLVALFPDSIDANQSEGS